MRNKVFFIFPYNNYKHDIRREGYYLYKSHDYWREDGYPSWGGGLYRNFVYHVQ